MEIRGDGRVTAEVRVLPRYRTGPFLRRYRDEAMQVLHYRYAPFSGRTRFSESVVLRMQLDDRLLFR